MSFPTTARRIPVATYRLQLRREFPFSAAAELVPYFQQLGISDLYCSPIFLSTPGSSHGYDVNDYRRIDPELGGRFGLETLHEILQRHGLGLLLDFVPNHMGINGPGLLNRWWLDVLENGRHSRYASYFDIDWSGGSGRSSQVLVPVLDEHYGRVLEAGRLSLVCENGTLSVAFGDMRFPVSPETYRRVLASLEPSNEFAPLVGELTESFENLPLPRASEPAEETKVRSTQVSGVKQRFATLLNESSQFRTRLEERLRQLNGTPGEPTSFDELDRIIARQHYRLAYWKAGVHETNYRRFFAIDTLIGLHMEIPEVFHETHALLARLVREGMITGLRIDHVDGLRDPQQYLDRLQGLGTEDRGKRTAPLFVLVEKILGEHESLPTTWAVHGTTGYEFISQLAEIFVNPQAERRLMQTYRQFTGEDGGFDAVVYEKKRLVLEEMFANAVTHLTNQLADLLQTDRTWRDLTRHELQVALREVMASHSVYRTYRRSVEKMTDRDRRVVEQAAGLALIRNPRLGSDIFGLIRDVLTGAYPPPEAPDDLRFALAEWVLSFQQYTGAVMAKAVEDTAFYTYGRFIALNEVGGNPGHFGGTIGGFHGTNRERLERAPHNLLATGTHDMKLGEDARARLYALSEIPHEWTDCVEEWRELNRRFKTVIDGRPAPDANEEYRLYQILLAVWPADDAPPDDVFRGRIRDYARKAANEAKRNTTWIQQNERWLEAIDRFIDQLLGEETGRDFLASFTPRARRVAHLGMVNSLSQLVLKVTCPGVPDFYQGSELWDFSLVDPDNRRLVDYGIRRMMIENSGGADGGAGFMPTKSGIEKPAGVKAASQQSAPSQVNWSDLLRDWRTGAIKLQLTRTLLRFRTDHSELFRNGTYEPVETQGRFREHIVAFSRRSAGETVVVAVPRLTSRLGAPPLGLVWDNAMLVMPEPLRRWHDVVTGETFGAADGLPLTEVFRVLPFAVLQGC